MWVKSPSRRNPALRALAQVFVTLSAMASAQAHDNHVQVIVKGD
jgi:hypothetical protein